MFDPSKMSLPESPSIAKRLNYAIADRKSHNTWPSNFEARFVQSGKVAVAKIAIGGKQPYLTISVMEIGSDYDVAIYDYDSPDTIWNNLQTTGECGGDPRFLTVGRCLDGTDASLDHRVIELLVRLMAHRQAAKPDDICMEIDKAEWATHPKRMCC